MAPGLQRLVIESSLAASWWTLLAGAQGREFKKLDSYHNSPSRLTRLLMCTHTPASSELSTS